MHVMPIKRIWNEALQPRESTLRETLHDAFEKYKLEWDKVDLSNVGRTIANAFTMGWADNVAAYMNSDGSKCSYQQNLVEEEAKTNMVNNHEKTVAGTIAIPTIFSRFSKIYEIAGKAGGLAIPIVGGAIATKFSMGHPDPEANCPTLPKVNKQATPER